MKSRLVVILAIWGGLLWGVLQFGEGTDHDAHAHQGISVCGAWGCGPPVRALASWHGFWLVFVSLPVGLLIRSWPARRLKAVGLGLTGAGVLGLIAVVAYEAVTWLPGASDLSSYFVQRCIFAVATLTDIPLIPTTIGGVALWISGTVKSRKRGTAAIASRQAGETPPSAGSHNTEPERTHVAN